MSRAVRWRDERRRAGLTLVEVALIVSILGVACAVAVPTFIRSVRTSKVAEASSELQRMQLRAVAYYSTPQPVGEGKRLRCLPNAAGPTPALPSTEPVEVQFSAPETPGAATWAALGYEPEGPVRYSYSFLPAMTGCAQRSPVASDGPVLTLRAEGDLDGDGLLSRFERRSQDLDGELVPDPLLIMRDRIE
jgi:Tfp pilus assembly protein PilE